MEIKDTIQWKENTIDVPDMYIPSSSEKKKAIMMYLFFGIIVWLLKKDQSPYELYHLKQSSWRWIVFICVIILDIVLLLLPVLKYIWLIPILILVICWIISMRHAWDWKYFVDKRDSALALFSGVWWWFLDLFELWIKTDTKNEGKLEKIDETITLDSLQWKNTSLADDTKTLDKQENM